MHARCAMSMLDGLDARISCGRRNREWAVISNGEGN